MSRKPKNNEQIKEAFRLVDREILRIKLNVSKTVMSQIVNGLDTVSAKRAKDIELHTCGLIPAKILRPDIFGA